MHECVYGCRDVHMNAWMDECMYADACTYACKLCMYYVYMHIMLTYVCVRVGMQTEVTNLIESDRVEHKAQIHTHN